MSFHDRVKEKEQGQRNEAELLKEIYNLQKESSERDTKLETTITYMDKRLQTMEELTSKMSETLNKQQLIQAQVASLATEITDIKTDMCLVKTDISSLKNAGKEKLYTVLSKIAWIIIPMFIASIYGYLASKGFFKG